MKNRTHCFFLLLGAVFCVHLFSKPVFCESEFTGAYRRVHTVQYFDGEKNRQLEAVDTIVINKPDNDRFPFTIDTVASNGHTCSMEGMASRTDDYLLFRELLDTDTDLTGSKPAECVLELRLNGETVELHDVGNNCRIFYCGMHARLDGLVFTRTDQAK